jgi:predicted AlkP superfamily pyrophosphatase or phosphodiesterase
MGKEAIKSEGLGKDQYTDMLALSFSSPDYIGHKFGPNSIEVEDTYLRFDKDLAAFVKYIDETVGKGQYLIFLTADHGVAQIPGFMKENRLPAGTMDDALIMQQVNDSVKKEFGISNLIDYVLNYQVYLNEHVMVQSKASGPVIKNYIIQKLLQYPGIAHAVDLATLNNFTLPQQVKDMLANGYSPKRSGDIQFIFKPQWFDGWGRGTTHGVWNPYDSHIPLIWYGTGIKPGKLYREVYMTDIAPTLAAMLQIQMPNASIGKVIEEVFDK